MITKWKHVIINGNAVHREITQYMYGITNIYTLCLRYIFHTSAWSYWILNY